jgi:lysophospholipase L1-like esterase
MVVLGDSYTEQTYTAGSQCAGIVSQMQTLLPQMDIWALGEGGTGFYDGGIAGGTNFLGRLQDIVYANPNYIVIYGGIDDLAYVTNSSLDNPVFVNATNLIQSLQTQLPSAKIVVIGPQSPRGLSPITDSNVFNFGNLLNAACSACGVPYVSPIAPQWITGDVSIPNSGNADVYTIPIEGTHPTIPAGAKFYALKIVSALSSIWNLSNPASGQANSTFELLTNGIPTPVPGIGILWNSNNVLYWVTTANTNYISGP